MLGAPVDELAVVDIVKDVSFRLLISQRPERCGAQGSGERYGKEMTNEQKDLMINPKWESSQALRLRI